MTKNTGHRERVLTRFEKSGLRSFHDYEILELLLTFIFPRIDTKKIAKSLLKKFKTLNSVLSSDPKVLTEIDGMGMRSAIKLKFFKELISYCLKERPIKLEIISSRADVEEYLRIHFGFRSDEYMAAIFLNNSHEVIEIEELSEGTVNRCHIYPRKLFKQAFKFGAAAIILAHNHPGGSTIPSAADWKLTKEIKCVGKAVDISLLDHIIITNDVTVSMREMSLWPAK